eukprot:CCRYP_014094-RA/>CCRYP_014094-RA protein AED:0.12 eAED:0.01 QI:0/0/0/1/1/1/2/0/1245
MDQSIDESEEEDDKTVITSNKSSKHECDQATITTAELTDDDISSDEETPGTQRKPPEYTILDSGATAHFRIKGAMVKNKQPTCNPLKIKLPDGSVIQSTHTCNLDIPWLPDSVTEAHIVPGLAHSLLVATRKFCDAGCKIIFDLDGCRIIYKGNVVLTGTRDPSSGLWRVPINPTSTLTTLNHRDLSNVKKDQQYAANLYTLTFKQQQLKYMHQSFFSPPPHTLIKAINNGQLEGIPFMKADLVRKYLAPSPAISKGRMKRPRQGIRSTRQRPHMAIEQECPTKDTPSSFTTNANIIPIEPTDECACNVLCYAALADKHSGTMHTDATGALPAVSLEGNQYYFISYAYDLNYIFALPISNLRDESILKAFDEVFQELKSKGFKPAFNVTNNQAATPIKKYLSKDQTSWQFVEPNNHRHTQEIYNELFESIQKLKKPAKCKFLKRVAKALDILTTTPQPTSPTAEGEPNSEGDTNDIVFQRVNESPKVTTSNNSTDPALIKSTQQIHQQHTRANTPGQLPAIINPANDLPATRRSPRLATIEEAPIITMQGPSSSRIPLHLPNKIAFQALNHLTQQVYTNPNQLWVPTTFLSSSPTDTNESSYNIDIEHFCNGVQHPVTGETITKYKKLINIPQMRDVWTTAFGKEFSNLAQGDDKTGETGTNSIFVMFRDEIANIPKGRTVTYGRIVIDYRPQKTDPNRVSITAGGNLIKDYPGELTTRTADLTTSKILWNSVLSTEGAKFMGVDIKSFYLTAPLDQYEYMKMPIDVFPEHTIQQYDLRKHVKNGFVYLEIRRCVYGLPMAGALANNLLRKRLAPHGYYEVAHTPGLWRHVTHPISFTLVVDDFGVKYEGQEHAQHLIDTLKKYYKLAEDWKGDLYCGITLNWDYENRTLDISLPGYIKNVLQRFEHKTPAKPQNCPFQPNPHKYGKDAQDPLSPDTSVRPDLTGTRRVQQVVGALLFYAQAVHNTLLPGLSAIASEQPQATTLTMDRCRQMLEYCASNPDAKVRFRTSDMILNIHSDASYLSATRAPSQVAGYYFLGSIPTDDAPIKLNGAILVFCGILKFVVASAAEAELGALFLNCKEGKLQFLILEELGHPQPPTPIHCDNATATGIANDTLKKQRARAMEMKFFWVTDQVKQKFFNVRWQPGQENLADYFTKHFEPRHHLTVRPWYLHTRKSPSLLPRANAPSSLRRCLGTLPNGYTRASPLPRIPSTKCRVPLGRQLPGLLHCHQYIAAPICVRAASMA